MLPIPAFDFEKLFPIALHWALEQQKIILQTGTPLSEDQQIDAWQVGVREIEKVRLMKVDRIPAPMHPDLQQAMNALSILGPETIGLSLGHGIFIRADQWDRRELVVHELVHTFQVERVGDFGEFLREYLLECLQHGYHEAPFEIEARTVAQKICNQE